MSDFTQDWLSLREPADRMSRSAPLVAALGAALAGRTRPFICDLGAGTGANLRALAPHLGPDQRWLLIDHDAALLEAVVGKLDCWAAAEGYRFCLRGEAVELAGQDWQATVRRRVADLAGRQAEPSLQAADVITASALLDLVSPDWLRELIGQAGRACAYHFSLCFDGRTTFQPADPDDAGVTNLFLADQRRDKGLGQAMGPACAQIAADLLREAGLAVRAERSDWLLRREQRELQAALLRGVAAAASEQAPNEESRFRSWLRRREALLAEHGAVLRIGHQDLLALRGGDG